MSAHLSEFPVGKYKKAHRHGAGAHIIMLTGSGYSFLWEEGAARKRVEWGRMSMFVPPIQWWHQHFNNGAEPARYLALKPWGFKYKVEELKDTGEDVKKGGAQIEYEDQDPEIHQVFEEECRKSGAHVDMTQFGF